MSMDRFSDGTLPGTCRIRPASAEPHAGTESIVAARLRSAPRGTRQPRFLHISVHVKGTFLAQSGPTIATGLTREPVEEGARSALSASCAIGVRNSEFVPTRLAFGLLTHDDDKGTHNE